MAKLLNTKARTLTLLGIVALVLVFITIYFITKKPTLSEAQQSKTSKAPKIESVPGGVTSEKYRELQQQDNIRRAEEALKKGTSAIPTIIGSAKGGKSGSETFGIEDQLLKGGACRCPCPTPSGAPGPCTAAFDPILAAKLKAELDKDPSQATTLFRQNPCFSKVICQENPKQALSSAKGDKEAAKILLTECPSFAKLLAEEDPAYFKQLMLENPELAKQLAEQNPELFKKLMTEDPEFAKALAKANPDLVKTLMANDAAFANKMIAANPEMVKDLMKNDPAFAATLMKNNPAAVKKLILDDPEFAKAIAKNNPDALKDMMRNDPEFARALAAKNPDIVKDLMRNDPEFAKDMARANPDMVKKLMLDDPEFAREMAKQNPDMVKKLMLDDPEFAKKLAESNPELVKDLMRNDPEFAKALAKANPELVQKLMLDDPEFAKEMAKQNPDMVNELMKNDPAFAKALLEKNPGIQNMFGGTSQRDKERERLKAEAARRAAAQQQMQLNELQQKQVQALVQGMDAQAKSAMDAWNTYPSLAHAQGEWFSKQFERPRVAPVQAGAPKLLVTKTGKTIKAGTILFAVLDTSVNSDEPGPVLATIVGGDLRGAKLLGTMSATIIPGSNSPEKVTLNFNLMSIPEARNSIPISAVAVDPDTARTALASDVDHHYFLRYAAIFASAFMTGYAQVITSQGTVQQTATNGQSVTTQSPQLSGRQQIYAALGNVGQKWGAAVAPLANRPYTVTVKSGVGLGILFLADVREPR